MLSPACKSLHVPARISHRLPMCTGEHICVHIRAAAQAVGYTHLLREQAAAHLVENGRIEVDRVTRLCIFSTLSDITKPVYCRPDQAACTCHGQAQHGHCCHLLAAQKLPLFKEALPLTLQLAVPEDASAVCA